jgi:hypothetical protein
MNNDDRALTTSLLEIRSIPQKKINKDTSFTCHLLKLDQNSQLINQICQL